MPPDGGLPRLSELTAAGLGLHLPERQRLSFRAVNRRDAPGHEPGLQRHHLLPRQILQRPCFGAMLGALGPLHFCLEDFRRNGLLLPANDAAAVRIGLPLHRGPHREYNQMVSERVGQIEAVWAAQRLRRPDQALLLAYRQLEQLQLSLRSQLLDQHRRLRLNRKDPLGQGVDFKELDAMAAQLWPETEPIQI